jgi:hypothetical protein
MDQNLLHVRTYQEMALGRFNMIENNLVKEMKARSREIKKLTRLLGLKKIEQRSPSDTQSVIEEIIVPSLEVIREDSFKKKQVV